MYINTKVILIELHVNSRVESRHTLLQTNLSHVPGSRYNFSLRKILQKNILHDKTGLSAYLKFPSQYEKQRINILLKIS